MSFYGYPNARLRARKEKIFDSDFFDQLLKARKSSDVVAALTETDYRKDIEKGLLKDPGIAGLEEGLKLHLINTFNEVKRLLKGNKQGLELLGLIAARFDLHNIKTILRGFHSNTAKEEVLQDLIPAGQLDETILSNLVNQLTLKACIDQLVIFKIPYYKPLIEDYTKYANTNNLADLEMRLDKFYYSHILKKARGFSRNTKIVRELVKRDIDMNNIMTLLRLTREMPFLESIQPQQEQAPSAEEDARYKDMGPVKQKVLKAVRAVKIASVATGKFLAKIVNISFQALKRFVIKTGAYLKQATDFILYKFFGRQKKPPKQKIYVVGEQQAKKAGKLSQLLNKTLNGIRQLFDTILHKLFKRKPKAVKAVKKVEEEKQLDDFFIEGGLEITKAKFLNLAKLGKVESIVEGLKGTAYYKPMKEGMKSHLITGSLAALERKIEDFNIKKIVHLLKEDPLSIGIVIGYTWSKYNEVINLRIILRGKEVEMPEKQIKEALVLV